MFKLPRRGPRHPSTGGTTLSLSLALIHTIGLTQALRSQYLGPEAPPPRQPCRLDSRSHPSKDNISVPRSHIQRTQAQCSQAPCTKQKTLMATQEQQRFRFGGFSRDLSGGPSVFPQAQLCDPERRDHALRALPSGADGNVRWSGTKGPGTCVRGGRSSWQGRRDKGQVKRQAVAQNKRSGIVSLFVCMFVFICFPSLWM